MTTEAPKTTHHLHAIRIDNGDLRIVYNLAGDWFTIELPPSKQIPFDQMDLLLVGLGKVRGRRAIYQNELRTTRKIEGD